MSNSKISLGNVSDDSQAKAPSIAQSKISQVKVINPSKIRVHINGDKKATSTVTASCRFVP